MIFENNSIGVALTWLIVELAAINWALVEFFDYNAVTALLGVESIASTVAFGVIGVAGVVSLADSLGLINIQEVLP